VILATIPAAIYVGALMYALATNPKLSEIGRLMFFVGLIVALFVLGREVAVRIP
jgi:Na+/phosphate symporter